MKIRKAKDRGYADHGWLKAKHTFSFADYQDPQHMGFRSLRVMNEDRVEPGQGFGMHPHHDMEIVTYVIDGQLEHKDNMGNGSVVQAGELQCMTAGTGVLHSEFNPSDDQEVHLYQIWLRPIEKGLQPGYDQRRFSLDQEPGCWHLVASQDGRQNSMIIHQDASIYMATLAGDDGLSHELVDGRGAWVQVVRGQIDLNGQILEAGDGAAFEKPQNLQIKALQASQVMLFDLK